VDCYRNGIFSHLLAQRVEVLGFDALLLRHHGCMGAGGMLGHAEYFNQIRAK
jgi:hypothetical protein